MDTKLYRLKKHLNLKEAKKYFAHLINLDSTNIDLTYFAALIIDRGIEVYFKLERRHFLGSPKDRTSVFLDYPSEPLLMDDRSKKATLHSMAYSLQKWPDCDFLPSAPSVIYKNRKYIIFESNKQLSPEEGGCGDDFEYGFRTALLYFRTEDIVALANPTQIEPSNIAQLQQSKVNNTDKQIEPLCKPDEEKINPRKENNYLKTIYALAQHIIDDDKVLNQHTKAAEVLEAQLANEGLEFPVGKESLGGYLLKAKELVKGDKTK